MCLIHDPCDAAQIESASNVIAVPEGLATAAHLAAVRHSANWQVNRCRLSDRGGCLNKLAELTWVQASLSSTWPALAFVTEWLFAKNYTVYVQWNNAFGQSEQRIKLWLPHQTAPLRPWLLECNGPGKVGYFGSIPTPKPDHVVFIWYLAIVRTPHTLLLAKAFDATGCPEPSWAAAATFLSVPVMRSDT